MPLAFGRDLFVPAELVVPRETPGPMSATQKPRRDDSATNPPGVDAADDVAVEAVAEEDRSTAPADPHRASLVDEPETRVAELDAVAWNLPAPRRRRR